MSRIQLIGLVTLIQWGGLAQAAPLDELKFAGWVPPGESQRVVLAPLGGNTVDDYVIALSKSLKINLILDASGVDQEQRVDSFPSSPQARAKHWPSQFSTVLTDFTVSQQLAKLRFDDSTYLFWKKPSVVETARATSTFDGYLKPHPVNQPIQLFHALDALVQKLGTEKDPSATQELSQFPVAVQADIVAGIRRSFLSSSYQADFLLSDDFWKSAVVQFGTIRTPRHIFFKSGGDSPVPFFHIFDGTLVFDQLAVDDTNSHIVVDLDANEQKIEPENATEVKLDLVGYSYPAGTAGLDWESINNRAGFNIPLTLEWNRQPLGKALDLLGKEHGVKVSLDPKLDERKLMVTAAVKNMTGASLLTALGRTFLLQIKQEGGNLVWLLVN